MVQAGGEASGGVGDRQWRIGEQAFAVGGEESLEEQALVADGVVRRIKAGQALRVDVDRRQFAVGRVGILDENVPGVVEQADDVVVGVLEVIRKGGRRYAVVELADDLIDVAGAPDVLPRGGLGGLPRRRGGADLLNPPDAVLLRAVSA